MTKTEYAREIADRLEGVSAQDIKVFLDVQEEVVGVALQQADEGESIPVIPGAIVLKKKFKPAQKARRGTNPFTGEPTTFKAKPASWQVKAYVRKRIKDLV